MSDNKDFLDLIDEVNKASGLSKPKLYNIAFAISRIDGEGIIVACDELDETDFFDGSLLQDNITDESTIPTDPGFYKGKLKVHKFTCNHPQDPTEFDVNISLEDIELIVDASRARSANYKEWKKSKELKPSGIGIVVDKSNATETHPCREGMTGLYPPYHDITSVGQMGGFSRNYSIYGLNE